MNKNFTLLRLLSFLLIAVSQNGRSQKLYTSGTHPLVTFDITTNTTTPIGTFTTANIGGTLGRLVYLGNGEIAGVTNQSPNLYGALFKTDTANGSVSVLYQFTNNNKPQSSFVLANDGKLYCLANTGTSNESAIYSFDLSTNTYTKVLEINGNAGSTAQGGFVKAGNGKLYGVTKRGGLFDKGTIFSYDPSSNTHAKLYDFNTLSGTDPNAAMIQATDGKLYGVAAYGGVNDKGVIFSFDIGSNTYTKLYDFVQSNGECPTSPLYQASNGMFYGTTMTGGAYYQGTLYSFNPNGNIYTCLHSFFAGDGYGPRVPPIEGAPGKLYGHTNQGGSNYNGSIYSYDLSTSTFTKLMNGNSTTGSFIVPFIKFYQATGINEVEAASLTLNVYPNPGNGTFRVAFNSTEKIDITIYNNLGEKVKHIQNAETGCEINTMLSKGIYNCTFSANGNYIASHKLIVQ